MNKILISLAIIGILGILVSPVLTLAGDCGVGSDCEFCLTQETCEAQENCKWETTECVFDGLVPFAVGDLSSIMARIPEIWGDLVLLIVVAMGLPIAFWVVRKSISLVRAR